MTKALVTEAPVTQTPGTKVAVPADFPSLSAPFRRELFVHCYRMLGSVQDAEDLVQETYLRAWRSWTGFEGRASLRTWLYRIATTACLTALESRERRPLPVGLGSPAADPADSLDRRPGLSWLEPVPDHLLQADWNDPATIVTSRESVRLAFVAALQHLPPRQRAVLILRDVLQWRAAEVAESLGITTTAVNSMLQRARTSINQLAPSPDTTVEPSAPEQRQLVERYVRAFESKDISALVELFTADAVWEMPPYVGWYRGGDQIVQHLAARCLSGPGPVRLVPASANGQRAFGTYLPDPAHGGYRLVNLQVLTLAQASITHVTAFADPPMFAAFHLPQRLPA
ncbi:MULTISPECIES: sigma-70 family RNA polymerase sigma factor [unclassified Micromonospora]|uniref:sigma-70 family RNA polymerase sigma factor n=1 Tax=unclassified Micromonospora TaxID=2617518 RepID=UPI003A88ACDB